MKGTVEPSIASTVQPMPGWDSRRPDRKMQPRYGPSLMRPRHETFRRGYRPKALLLEQGCGLADLDQFVRQCSHGQAVGVQGIGFTDAAVLPGIQARSLGHGESVASYGTGEDRYYSAVTLVVAASRLDSGDEGLGPVTRL